MEHDVLMPEIEKMISKSMAKAIYNKDVMDFDRITAVTNSEPEPWINQPIKINRDMMEHISLPCKYASQVTNQPFTKLINIT